jgi:hypothetical protein
MAVDEDDIEHIPNTVYQLQNFKEFYYPEVDDKLFKRKMPCFCPHCSTGSMNNTNCSNRRMIGPWKKQKFYSKGETRVARRYQQDSEDSSEHDSDVDIDNVEPSSEEI